MFRYFKFACYITNVLSAMLHIIQSQVLLERSLDAMGRLPNFDNARNHCAQNGKYIGNTGVALAVYRWRLRCYSVVLTVESVG